MIFVDTHCHITDESFRGKDATGSDESLGYIQRAVAAGVEIMLQADIDSTERSTMLDIVRRYPQELRAMIGLYPGTGAPYGADIRGADPNRKNGPVFHWEEVR